MIKIELNKYTFERSTQWKDAKKQKNKSSDLMSFILKFEIMLFCSSVLSIF